MKFSRCSLGILQRNRRNFQRSHFTLRGNSAGQRFKLCSPRTLYLQRNSSATAPILCWSTNRRKKKKTRRGVSTFELFFFWKKQRRFERYNARELRLFSVKFSKARSQDIRVSAPRLTIDRDTLQLRNLPVPSNELTIRRQFVRYRLHAIYTFPGSLNYGTVGRTLCDIRKWTWNNQCL